MTVTKDNLKAAKKVVKILKQIKCPTLAQMLEDEIKESKEEKTWRATL